LYLLGQDTDGTQCARLADIQVALLGGIHHDRDGGSVRIALDGLNGLEPVHARHHVIHEDHIRGVLFQVIERSLRRIQRSDREAVFLQHALERFARCSRVIYHQGETFFHGLAYPAV
jgi:hypothetical protein